MNACRPTLPQRRAILSRRALAGLAVLTLAASAALGQRANQAQGGSSQSNPSGRETEDAIVLSPFEVREEADRSYGALNSNSLTAFSTELKTMPVSADVFSETFIRDIGLNSIEEVINNFSAGAGTFSLQPDGSAANNQPLDRNANGSLSIRGLSAPTMQVNGFFPAGGNGINATGITSRFNIERVEVIGGPQALLYGVSGSGGVTNLITKRAQFNRRSSGELRYEVNSYGYKQGQLDYSWGGERVAVRVALLDQMLGARRLFIGGPIQAGYLQLALRPFKTTVLRYSLERSNLDRINANSGSMTLTALNTANDARSGQQLHWLLATNQVMAAANGAPSGAGPIMNGNLTWDNVDSVAGGMSGEIQKHMLQTLTAESRWNSWLSTQVSAGYRTEKRWKMMNSGATFLAPNVASNPLGTWAVTIGSGSGASTNYWQPVRQKVARFSALAENDLFNGRAKSKTVVGLDTTRTDGALLGYYFVQMDENWNPVMGSTRFNGYTPMPAIYWPVTNGPVRNPLWNRGDARITYNGVNYERKITNYSVPELVSPTNPEGLTGNGTGSSRHTTDIQSGYYAANFTDWFNGKFTTLLGVRMGRAYARSSNEASLPNQPSVGSEGLSRFTAFSAGANFAVTRTIRAYVEASDNYNPAATSFADPYGEFSKSAKGMGAEAGLKVTAPNGKLSGTLAVFHTKSKNELHAFTSTLTNYINPAGLNGRLGAASNTINVDRQSLGMQMTVTASPMRGWRMRMSGAYIGSEIATARAYDQLYNDQFYATAQGQVTYRDGTPVYVNPARTEVLPSTATNAVPLTLALMNTQSSRYWANPVAVSGAITSNSAVATVLRTVDPVHGPILTGAIGLPISSLQIAPNPAAPPPGRISVTEKGDTVTGVPKYSLNMTNVYTIQTGWFKGVRLGGSVNAYWKSSLYYYYPNGAADPNNRTLWSRPDLVTFSGILGYERKIGRYVFSTQLNVQNMFNNYNVVPLPNYVNGWAGPNNATFDAQPRMYVWSMGVEF